MRADRQRIAWLECYVNFPYNTLKVLMFPMGFVVREAAGVVIVTPEYNYGIPGGLKNALDWLSRPGFKSVFAGKRVAVLSVSPSVTGGVRAQGALKTVLGGMVAQVFPFPEVCLAGALAARGDDGGLADAGSRERVAGLVQAFVASL